MAVREAPTLLSGESAKMYDVQTVAKVVKRSRETIYNYLREGLFPNARIIGKRDYFIPHEDFRMFLGYDPITGQPVGILELEEYRKAHGLQDAPLAQ